ncbi:sulfotransferase [Shimia sp. SDUM112013]|uniref:sulfotransferase n=1 Tax=Shimia sp. SDUM112013 TaxID=3136160 RepID=UPI0032EFCCFF
MVEQNATQPVVFVGGAPRSGTTVTHELLCTSTRTNAYHPEISFVLPLVNSYALGKNNWSNHTNAFFAEPEHFRIHVANLVNTSLQHVSLVLGNPEVLTVKNPLMTPKFPVVRELLGERTRFVTVVRHPYDVVRSRQEVAKKSEQEFNERMARNTARSYNETYAHLDNPILEGSLFHFRYEDILVPETIEGLRNFTGLTDLDPDKVGVKESAPQKDAGDSNPWYSPKYHGPINTKSRLSPLEEKYRKVVREVCAPMMERFNYTNDV